MKPIAILHNDECESADYLTTWLGSHHLPFQVLRPFGGDAVPKTMLDFSGVVVLSSRHSVHESLPCIRAQHDLIRKSLHADKPVMGIGFGGQLLALVMGAQVHRCAKPCVGWHSTCTTGWSDSRRWLGSWREIELLYWHNENFTIPATAKRILFGQHCLNVGFVQSKHIGLQCNVNFTQASLAHWVKCHREDIFHHSEILSEQVLTNGSERFHAMHRVADSIYGRWLRGFNRPLFLMRPSA